MGQIIAAIDLGTSKSIALVAQKEDSGKLSVLQSETQVSKNAIRRGRVYNIDETSGIISELIRKLNNNSSFQIEKVYVGVGGQSFHTHSLNIRKTVEDGTISRQLIDSINEEAKNYRPEFEDNFGIFSCEYFADGQLISNPAGTMASVVEARFQLILGNPCLKRNIETVFQKKNFTVADYYISPLATAEAVLTPEEKESGCALIEFGEGVTYISVYKNKTLKFLVTLPLGGLSITKDIRNLNVSEEEAEALKIRYGSAIPNGNSDETVKVNSEHNSSWNIKLYDLNCIIEARVDEIVKNVWNMIQKSGYTQNLYAGIVITGGGALLRDLPQFIKNQTGKDVRVAKPKVLDTQTGTYLQPANSCVAGLAIMGEENCVRENLILHGFSTKESIEKQKALEKQREKERKEKERIEREKVKAEEDKIKAENERLRKEKEKEEKEKERERQRLLQIQRDEEKRKNRQLRGDGTIKRGVKKIVEKTLEIFKEDDYENPVSKPAEDNFIIIQPDDEDSEK